jgi:cell division protein FtsL
MTAARVPGPLALVGRVAFLVAAVAAVGIVHVWAHTRVTAAGYRLGELQRAQEALRVERDRLEVEVATLRAPGRLEEFARTRLGMAPPAPGAVVAGGSVEAAGRAGRAGGEENHRRAPAEPVVRERSPREQGTPGVRVAAREARARAAP